VSPEGVRVDNIHSKQDKRESGKIVFGFLGNIAYHKGLHILVEAFRNIDQTKAALKVYGRPADDDASKILATKLEHECHGLNVEFMGGYRHEELLDILSGIDAIVHPSIIHESSSIIIREAMAAKVPVIVSDVPAQCDAIRDGIDGLHFRVQDAVDLNHKMKLLVEHPEKLREFRQNMPSVRTIGDQASEIAEIYEGLIHKTDRNPVTSEILTRIEAIRERMHTKNFEQQINVWREEVAQTEPLMKTLLEIYDSRRDLQEAYPQVRRGEFGGLWGWALDVIRRKQVDSSYEDLVSSASKPLLAHIENLNDLEKQVFDKDSHIANLEAKITAMEKQIQLKDDHIGNLDGRLRSIENSLAWKLIARYRRFNDRLFPPGTRRRAFNERIALALKITLDKGPSGLFSAAFDRYIVQLSQMDPDARYQLWLKSNLLTQTRILEIDHEISEFSMQPRISIVMPAYNTDPRWLKAAIESVRAQLYQNWELCIADDHSSSASIRGILNGYAERDTRIKITFLPEHRGIAGASNEGLKLATGEYVGLLDHDDELSREALYEVIRAINKDPSIDYIYTDEDKLDSSGRRVEAFFKPDWSPDLLLSMNYVTHFSVYRRSLLEALGGFRLGYDGSQDYDLALRFTETTDRIRHIPKPLYSWRKIPGSSATVIDAKPSARRAAMKALNDTLQRRSILGSVEDGYVYGYYRVRYRIAGAPLISIIILNKNKVELLRECVESIRQRTSYGRYELVIVDNNSNDREALEYLSTLPQVIRFTEPYNFSRMSNLGAAHSKGDYLVFLNNDTEVVTPEWIESLLEHAQRTEVGMVGPVLLYPPHKSGGGQSTIQNGGEVIAAGGVANGAFRGLRAESAGYFSLAKVIRNCSSVTAAALMVRRSVFQELGGFDEGLPVAFNDVDLCLRAREKGYRLVINPHAVLYHHEKATRGEGHPRQDETYFIAKWSHVLVRGDPYYNPNLSHVHVDHSIAPHRFCECRALAILLELYHERRDLPEAYPEAAEGKHQRLTDWAATSGVTLDSARDLLRPYANYYLDKCSKELKPLATLLHAYNLDQELQDSYPEVLKGDFERLKAAASQLAAP
jgi:GT2 family glycosyltransferase